MVDGSSYRGEIAYKDDKMIILKVRKPMSNRVRLFLNGILSIREIGWKKAYTLR
jgi:hypothetical protein